MQLTFKIKKAKEHGRSGIEIILRDDTRRKRSKQAGPSKCVAFVRDTDNLLQTLDKLLKRNRIELESLSDIKVEIEKGAGLTSTRIVSSIVKALSLDL